MLSQMAAEWPFSSTLLNNVSMTLAKTDLQIAERYVHALVPAPSRHIFNDIIDEHARTPWRNCTA